MKNLRSMIALFIVSAFVIGIGNTGCNRDKKKGCTDPNSTNYDPAAETDDGSCQYDPGTSGSELLSLKVTSAPTIDGTIDPAWANCTKLVTKVAVPDPGGDYFKGYTGNSYDVTMRSMYDDNNIYFLAEWIDPTQSLNRQSWYFDPAAKRWKQEKNKPTFDAGGTKTRDAFYEDKFAMLWNVGGSVPGWEATGCYTSCHTGLDPATHFGAPALHYTGAAGQRVDMWHWKGVRNVDQFDDQYQDENEFRSSGGKPEGGRTSDPKTAGGYSDNIQTLAITGDTTKVTVPKYVIPNRTNYYWVTQTEIDNTTAKLVTAVSATGVLTYAGGSIDPNTDTEYQRKGATTGSKCMPSVIVAPIVGDRGDISSKAVYSGGKWLLEYKRVLKTSSGDAAKTDVQFNTTLDYVFGIAVFENAAIAHAIKPFLTLKFKK